MMFIAIKTKDGVIKGKLSFYCRMLGVSRQGFYKYLAIKDRPWKYQDLADAMRVIHAEDGINLQVEKGEFLCISGRSGSGKSTLLSLLAGLESPTAGEIEILGQHLEQLNEKERSRFRRAHIGFVFQSYNLLPQFSAWENVAMPCRSGESH